MRYWNIFWRTFAQLELAVVFAAQGMDWASGASAFAVNADKLGALTLTAGIGGLVAVLWAWKSSPAVTPLEKALRSGAQTLVGALGAITLNSVADLTSLASVLVPSVVAVVLAFAVTYFQYQPAPEA